MTWNAPPTPDHVWAVEPSSSEFPSLMHTLAVTEWQFQATELEWAHGHASARYPLKWYLVYGPGGSHGVLVLFSFSYQTDPFQTFFESWFLGNAEENDIVTRGQADS